MSLPTEPQPQSQIKQQTPLPSSSPQQAQLVQVSHENRALYNQIKDAVSTIEGYAILLVLFGIIFIAQRLLVPLAQRWLLKPVQPFKHDIKIGQLMSFLLGRAGEGAVRVVLYEFHNGDLTNGGRHYNKISITNEEGVPKAAPFYREYQSAPIGVFNRSIEMTINNGGYAYITDLRELGEHEKILKIYDVKQVAQFLIYQNFTYYGILEVHYEGSDPVPLTLREDMEEVTTRIRYVIQTANASFWNMICQQVRQATLQQQASSLSHAPSSSLFSLPHQK